MPAYMKKALARRVDQIGCLSETDYIRAVTYSNLVMLGEMDIALEADLGFD